MWCRVLLIIVALTCTLQTEITTDTDDLLCVLILSGIQKEDLDVNLLNKLERHNVNVDELKNRKSKEDCYLGSTSKGDTNEIEATTETVTTTSKLPQIIKSPHSQMYGMILKPLSETIPTYNNNTNFTLPELKYNNNNRPVSQLIKLWMTYERFNQNNGNNDTEEYKNNEQLQEAKASNVAFLHKMVQTHNYYSSPYITTTESSITEKPLDIVSQQIMKFLKHMHTERLGDNVSEETLTEKPKVRKSTENNIELASSTENVNMTKSKSRSYNSKNIIDLWITINKTNDQSDIDQTTKTFTSKLDMQNIEKYFSNSKAPDKDSINKILSYIASQQSTTTTERTTSNEPVVSIQQLIKNLLQNNKALENKSKLLQEPLELDIYTKLDMFTPPNQNKQLKPDFGSNPPHQTHILGKSYLSENDLNYKSKKMGNGEINAELKYIELLKEYIATKSTELLNKKATAKDKHLDIMLQEIKEFLENKDKYLEIPKKTDPKEDKTIMLASTDMYTERNDRYSSNDKIISVNTEVPVKAEMQALTYSDEVKANSYSEELDQIFDNFENYFATKTVVTTASISPELTKHLNTIAQEIKEYFDESSRKLQIRPDRDFQLDKIVTPRININTNMQVTTDAHKIYYLNKKQVKLLSKSDSLALNPKTVTFSNDPEIAITKHVNESAKELKAESKLLQEDVIKEITKQIKASILKDLELHIPVKIVTTRETTTSSITKDAVVTSRNKLHTTTGIPRAKKRKENNLTVKSRANSTSVPLTKAEMKDMAEFFEMFQQFKNKKNVLTTPATLNNMKEPNQKSTNWDQGESHAIHRSLLPMYSDNNSHRMSMYNQHICAHPHQNLQVPKPSMQQTRTKINNEMREMGYNSQIIMNHPPKIIQTDALQVPLLAIPVSQSITPLNQNIILTTQNPIEQYKHIYEHNLHTRKPKEDHKLASVRHKTYSNERLSGRDYRTHGWSNTHHSSDIETDRSYDTDDRRHHSDLDTFRRRQNYTPHSRYFKQEHQTMPDPIRHLSTNRESHLPHHDFYKENLDTTRPKSVWDIIRPSPDHKYVRFHEKLERPEQWPRENRIRQNIAPRDQRKVNVASRQQVSLNEFKEKRKLYGDEHFFNFMQRQKKVNDMLESILAQKSDRIRSVETPDTIS